MAKELKTWQLLMFLVTDVKVFLVASTKLTDLAIDSCRLESILHGSHTHWSRVGWILNLAFLTNNHGNGLKVKIKSNLQIN